MTGKVSLRRSARLGKGISAALVVGALVAVPISQTALPAGATAFRGGPTSPPTLPNSSGRLPIAGLRQAESGIAASMRAASTSQVVPHTDQPLVAPLAPRMPASTTTFTVNSTADDPLNTSTSTTCVATNSKCTLRAAIEAADNKGTPVVVKLGASEYVLSDTGVGSPAGSLDITDAAGISVIGAGETKTDITVLLGDQIEPFSVQQNSKNQGALLYLSDLKVSEGTGFFGGALNVDFANSSAVLDNVLLTGNTGTSAGGAVSSGGHLYVFDSVVTGNEATGVGGGISVGGGSAVTEIVNTKDNSNTATGNGGGLYLNGGSTAEVSGGSISSNSSGASSTPGAGGGIYAVGAALSVDGTAINGNKVLDAGDGGGLDLLNSELSLTGGSLSSNAASPGYAGAALVVTSQLSLTNVTVEKNRATIGDILVSSSDTPSSVDVTGSTLSSNVGGAILALSESPAGGVNVAVSHSTLSGNSISSSYPCAPGICGMSDAGQISMAVTNSTIENQSFKRSAEAAGGIELAAAGGSGSLTLTSDKVEKDTATGHLSAGGVLVASVQSSSSYSPVAVNVTGTRFESDTAASGGFGGAIGINPGSSSSEPQTVTLALTKDTFSDNRVGTATSTTSSYGGAVGLLPGVTAAVTSCSFTGNSAIGASGDGGAVFDADESGVTYRNDSFTSNHAQVYGGGVVIQTGAGSITGSSFTGNTAGSSMGALWFMSSAATISDSTFADNKAGTVSGSLHEAGAIDIQGSNLVVTNSTFSGNSAGPTSGGGAITVEGSHLTLDSDTLVGNAATHGGGIYAVDGGQMTSVKDSIISHNTTKLGGSTEQDCFALKGAALPMGSAGGNVLGASSCVAALAGTDTVTTKPLVAALAKNGGPTETMALQAGSPALKRSMACPLSDQRGVARPAEHCDSGAYELTKA